MIRQNREILVVSTSSMEGWSIEQYIGPVSVHLVAGTNVFSDILASWTDVFGGRSGTYGNQLSRLYADAVELLRRRAEQMGANAVVGLSIDFDELSAQGKSMFMLNALGTAVRARRESREQAPLSGMAMDAEQMAALVRRNELLRSAKEGSLVITDDVWSYMTEYAVGELAPYALGVFLRDLQASESTERKHALDRARRYLSALDPEEAKTRMYRLLGHDSHPNSVSLRRAAVQLIRSLSLVDFGRIAQALEHPSAPVRHDALALLAAHPSTYRADDIPVLAALGSRILGAFPDLWEPVTRRGLLTGKEKQVWICPCGGTVNDGDTYCGRCDKDRFGMREGEFTVPAALAAVSARLRVLREAFLAGAADDSEAVGASPA